MSPISPGVSSEPQKTSEAALDNLNRIVFQIPDLKALTARYSVVDMHIHSHHSDGTPSVDDIAERAKELGIGVSVTDHNQIEGAVELAARGDVFNIPGIEVTSLEGTHLLVYFHDVRDLEKFYGRDILPHMGPSVMSSTELEMEEIVRRARQYPSLTVFAHPYSAAFTGVCNVYFPGERLEAVLAQVDGVEVINASNLTKWNLRCALLGFNLAKAVTGGSDSHSVQHIGRAVTYSDCRPTPRAFLSAVRKGRAKVVGKEIDLLRKVASSGFKLRTSLKNTPDLLEKNIRYGCTVINTKSRLFRERMRQRLDERRREDPDAVSR